MAKKKTDQVKEVVSEQEKLYLLKMILSKMSFAVAMNMMNDLKDYDKRTPALYNSCIKFLEQNDITFDKIATAREDDGVLDAILVDVKDSYETMLLDYDTFGSV